MIAFLDRHEWCDEGAGHFAGLLSFTIRREVMRMTIATLSEAARLSRGLSQSALADKSGHHAANISAIESGRRVPRVDTLDRILRTSGARLAISPTVRTTALEAGAEIRRALRNGDPSQAFRTWLAFNDDLAAETPTHRVVLTAFPPQSTGNALYDAALAALAEYRLAEASAPLPDWVGNTPVLVQPRVLTDSQYVTAGDLGVVPEPFRRRGVLIDIDSLQSA